MWLWFENWRKKGFSRIILLTYIFFSSQKNKQTKQFRKMFPPPSSEKCFVLRVTKKQSLNNITAHVHECCRLCFVTSSWPAVILSWLFKASALSYGWRKEIYPSHIGCDQKVNTEQTIFPQPSSETLTRRSEGLGLKRPSEGEVKTADTQRPHYTSQDYVTSINK